MSTSEPFDWAQAGADMPRVQAPCPHFGVCGGCRLQDLSYPDQLNLKEGRLRALFASLPPRRRLPPLAGPPLAYRTRLRFSVKNVPKKGGMLVGFHEKKKRYIVDMRECPILPDRVSRLIGPLRGLVSGLSLTRALPQISVSAAENQDAYVFRVMENPTEDDLALLAAFEAEHRIRIYLQTGGYETIRPLNPGAPLDLTYSLRDHALTIHYRPHHFTQVNLPVNEAMARQALELLKIQKGGKGLDLFCGVGNFTLVLARAGARVWGYDSEGDQIESARGNASSNRLSDRAVFEAADLYTETGVKAVDFTGVEFALLDPPRTGALEVCRAIPGDGPRRLLYISCNPETLSRDAEVLVKEKGYRLEALGLVDMFPQTLQAEAMAFFEIQ